jgi:hypothetical protein
MSHFREIDTQLTDAQVLREAVERLPYPIKTGPAATYVDGWNGIRCRAEIVLRVEGRSQPLDIGFARPSEGEPYQIVADWSMAWVDPQAFHAELRRAYAEIAAVKRATADKWTNFKRTVLPDGSIVIEAERLRA